MEDDVPSYAHGIEEIAIDFVEDVFRGPRRRIVQALGFLHFVRKVKYSSPIFRISNRPHFVPTSRSEMS